MKIQKHQKFQVSQLIAVFQHVESQAVGERPPGSSSRPALLLAQTKF